MGPFLDKNACVEYDCRIVLEGCFMENGVKKSKKREGEKIRKLEDIEG